MTHFSRRISSVCACVKLCACVNDIDEENAQIPVELLCAKAALTGEEFERFLCNRILRRLPHDAGHELGRISVGFGTKTMWYMEGSDWKQWQSLVQGATETFTHSECCQDHICGPTFRPAPTSGRTVQLTRSQPFLYFARTLFWRTEVFYVNKGTVEIAPFSFYIQ